MAKCDGIASEMMMMMMTMMNIIVINDSRHLTNGHALNQWPIPLALPMVCLTAYFDTLSAFRFGSTQNAERTQIKQTKPILYGP